MLWISLLLNVLLAAGILIRRRRQSSKPTSQASILDSELLPCGQTALLAILPQPILLLNAARELRYANPAAQHTYGETIQAMLRHPDLRAALEHSAGDLAPRHAVFHLAGAIDRDISADLACLPNAATEDGSFTIVVLNDLSREAALNRMRADFFANASHELRTPLASLIGFIETLQGPAAEDKPAQIRFLAIMAQQAMRMTRLIDDLSSLSRIEAIEHQPPRDRVMLPDLIRSAVAMLAPLAQVRPATFVVHIPAQLPPVQGDADQLMQMLQNLLHNAIKYGRANGTITITAEPAQDYPDGNGWPGVRLCVSDDGKGIPRHHLPRLTERFYRVDSARSREIGGTGLGLAIVKHIVNRHRGRLRIESREGEGVSVSIHLPPSDEG